MPGNPEIYAARADHTKQAEYAILTLFFVALKHNWTPPRLRTVLEQPTLDISPAAVDELIDAYDSHRPDLYVHSLTTGGIGGGGGASGRHSALPHLTDVEWKLTCDVRSSQLPDAGSCCSAGGPLNYTISLGRYQLEEGHDSGERESIATFQCNVEELQALIGKLKEVQRHCERLAAATTGTKGESIK